MNDAWGHPMWMTCNSHQLKIRSAGPDGVFNTDDDEVQLMSAASAATRSTE